MTGFIADHLTSPDQRISRCLWAGLHVCLPQQEEDPLESIVALLSFRLPCRCRLDVHDLGPLPGLVVRIELCIPDLVEVFERNLQSERRLKPRQTSKAC